MTRRFLPDAARAKLMENWQKFVQSLGIIAFVISPATGISGSVPTPRSPHSIGQVSWEFTPTKDKIPFVGGRTAGGYPCLKERWEWPAAIALMPDNRVVTTISANPTLYVYLPDHTAQQAELIVFDQTDNAIYDTSFTIPQTSGIIKVNLPETLALEIGKDYRWVVSVVCGTQDRSGDIPIEGIFRRIELDGDLKAQLEREKDSLEQARLYAKASIWNETLNIAVEARSQHPQEWEELLKSVKLEKYSQKLFLDCCTLSEPNSRGEK